LSQWSQWSHSIIIDQKIRKDYLIPEDFQVTEAGLTGSFEQNHQGNPGVGSYFITFPVQIKEMLSG